MPFLKKGTPLIFYDRVTAYSIGKEVSIDNINAAQIATNHLIAQGCKRIVHVLPTKKSIFYSDRLKGYKRALIENSIPFCPSLVIYLDFQEDTGKEIVNKILEMDIMPDGLFVSDDSCAASCIRHLKLKGIKIPEEIAIVGFNNEPISRLVEPRITTVNIPGFEMGEIAMKNLISHLQNPSERMVQHGKRITLPSELVIRESSLRK
jgi:LacI family transcriptional regulator